MCVALCITCRVLRGVCIRGKTQCEVDAFVVYQQFVVCQSMLTWFHCRRQHLGHLLYVNNLLQSGAQADVLAVILHDSRLLLCDVT